jgi:hypothetical protein
MRPQEREILFLFNHDAPHQVAHLAGIVRTMMQDHPDLILTCAVGTPDISRRLRALLPEHLPGRLGWLDLGLPIWEDVPLSLIDGVAPARRIARLNHHSARLGKAAIIVSAERTCLSLRDKWPAGHPTRFVHVPHGAGDRTVTYHQRKSAFDLILVSGPKAARELESRAGVPASKIRIVGYPKFDTVDLTVRARLFDNDNPVILYNPHFDPFLSSWYREGPALLDWFASAEGAGYNLVFAPHIMLFRKPVHISPEYHVARMRPGIRARWRAAPNILIDTTSQRLVDMSYTLAADAYIGDVSSQIYEFLARPRPAFFIDRFSTDRRSLEGRLAAWSAGDVVPAAQAIPPLLAQMKARGAHYSDAQAALFADTFSLDPARTASSRAAGAIAELARP